LSITTIGLSAAPKTLGQPQVQAASKGLSDRRTGDDLQTGLGPSLSGRALATLFAKVAHDVVVEQAAPSPIVVRLTGNLAADSRALAEAHTKRHTEELRVGHQIMLIAWDP